MTDQLSPLKPSTALDVERSREMAAAISRALRRAAREARQPAPLIVGGGVPVRRGDRLFRRGVLASFAGFVLLPALLAGIYWGLIASPQYATEVKFSLRASDSGSDSLAGLSGLPMSKLSQDSAVVVSYLDSPALLQDLIKTLNLRDLYSRPAIDYLSRLPADSPIEKFVKYWGKHISVQSESMSGIVTVNVRAFTPQDSQRIAAEILRSAENVVNEVGNRPRRNAVAETKRELSRAEEELQQATLAMRDVRNSEGVLDASASAEAISGVISELQLKLATSESALGLLGSQAQDAPQNSVEEIQIGLLKQEIDGLKKEIADSGGGSHSMANHLSVLSLVQTKLDAARDRYVTASATYRSAQLDLEAQRVYVVAFVQPILAQESTYPRRWLSWLFVVGPALALWSVGVALAAMARDNMAK